MRSYLVGVPLLCLAAVGQSALLTRYPVWGGRVDVVLLLVLSWTLAGARFSGVGWGVFGGLCLDVLSGGPLGSQMLALTLVAYLATLTEGRFWGSHLLLPLAIAPAGTLVFHGLCLLTLASMNPALNWGASLLQVGLPSAFLNTVFMLPVYYALRWVRGQVYPPAVTA